MISIVLPLLLIGQPTDQIAALHFANAKNGKLELAVHAPISGGLSTSSDVVATDPKFFRTDGNKPLQFVFGADIDGDGHDEIVVISQRMKQGSRYELAVYAPPTEMGENVSKPIASSTKFALGTPELFGTIMAAESLDIDGDRIDEFMILRESVSGAQRIEVRSLPTGLDQEISGIITSYPNVGQVPFDTVVDIAAVDIDADLIDEVGLVRHSDFGGDTLDIVRAPFVQDDILPVALFTKSNFSSALLPISNIEAVDVTGDGFDEMIVIRPKPAGTFQAAAYTLSSANGTIPSFGQTSPPVWSSSFDSTLAGAFVLRGPNASKDVLAEFDTNSLGGSYTLEMSHSVSFGYSGGETVNLGPTSGYNGSVNPGSNVVISGPNTVSLNGTFSKVTKTIDFSAADLTVVMPDGTTLFTHVNDTKVIPSGSGVEIRGTYSGTQKAPNGGSLTIQGGKFTLRHQF